ncbi:MAG: fatty acid--CoA ligase family protein [Verrucomicrobiota bacterium]
MLYDRWRQIAQERGAEIALRDVASNGQWTFAELARLTENGLPGSPPVVYPHGISAEFIFTVLRAWRDGRVVCPLETGQDVPAVPTPPPNIVHLKTTSATTGAPRVIAFTASQLKADVENIATTMGLRPEWPNVGVISLAHSYGFSNLVLPLLLEGIPLVLPGSTLPEVVRKIVGQLGPCVIPAVPALWRAWHEANAIAPNIRLAISAGAPLSLQLEATVFATTGLKIHNFYGASESGGLAFDSSDEPRVDADSAGLPLHDVRLTLDEAGRLQVRSRAVAESYWPERGADLGNGCFQTSDLAELMEGQVFLRGRASDLINMAGRKVAPETIEAALRNHPEVRECLVFGVQSNQDERTETIVACISTRSPVSPATLKQFLSQRLPAWQVPREWRFEDLETNARGKLSRAEWRRKWEHERNDSAKS